MHQWQLLTQMLDAHCSALIPILRETFVHMWQAERDVPTDVRAANKNHCSIRINQYMHLRGR